MNHQFDDDLVQFEKVLFHDSEAHLAHELKNESSILEKPLSTNTDVPGNINKPEFLNYWINVLKVDENFARFLITGYALKFKDGIPPPSAFSQNNNLFLENSEFGIEEIKRLEHLPRL